MATSPWPWVYMPSYTRHPCHWQWPLVLLLQVLAGITWTQVKSFTVRHWAWGQYCYVFTEAVAGSAKTNWPLSWTDYKREWNIPSMTEQCLAHYKMLINNSYFSGIVTKYLFYWHESNHTYSAKEKREYHSILAQHSTQRMLPSVRMRWKMAPLFPHWAPVPPGLSQSISPYCLGFWCAKISAFFTMWPMSSSGTQQLVPTLEDMPALGVSNETPFLQGFKNNVGWLKKMWLQISFFNLA